MERNLIGEMNMMKESGAKPNFTDIARRYGVDRHTVAKYWNGGGPQPPDGREGRGSGFDRYRAEIEGKAALPGMTRRGLHEFLLDRHAGDEPPVPGYNAFTHYLRTRGIAVGAGSPEAHPRFETGPGEQLQFETEWQLKIERGEATPEERAAAEAELIMQSLENYGTAVDASEEEDEFFH